MKEFIRKHAKAIRGVLSCFDRMLFRGYLPIMSGYAMASLLEAKNVRRRELKAFLLTQAARLKRHAIEMGAAAGRPYQYLGERARKDDLARQIAQRDRIDEGLICVFALLELSRTFSLAWKERTPFVQPTRRKCLQLYYYFMDRDLGLIHVKLQTWFPFPIQLYLNGHEWLARKLERRGIKYIQAGNTFVHLSDVERAQPDRRPVPERRLGPLALRAADQFAARRPAEADAVLLGDGAGGVLHRSSLPRAKRPRRPDAEAARIRHALLRRQGRDELPRTEAGGANSEAKW